LIEPELIEECRKGDLHNFRKVVEKTSPMVFSVAFRMLGDEDAARDIVQETMVTIWQKLAKFNTAGSYKTWVYRIAVNKCYDQLRKQKRRNENRYDDQSWALISNHLSEDGITELENEENAMIINLLTNKLSPKQKAVFILSELEEIPAGEIAEITGLSKSVVKANLYYARKNIESLLQKYLKR
jgi:RNA polymerase sigma-70 factor (ECF subfamily)